MIRHISPVMDSLDGPDDYDDSEDDDEDVPALRPLAPRQQVSLLSMHCSTCKANASKAERQMSSLRHVLLHKVLTSIKTILLTTGVLA